MVFSSALALVLLSQVAADGLTIDPGIPPDLTTWRWTVHDGKAALGWGRLNGEGRFSPVSPRPPLPLYPESEAVSAPIEGVPAYAINGVASSKLDDGALILRASDPATASEAKQAFEQGRGFEGPLNRLCPLKLGPDLKQIALWGLAGGFFASALWLAVSRRRPHPLE